MRVLLISSYKPLVKILKQGLDEEGFTVEAADHGPGGTDTVREGKYDAIIFDLIGPPEVGLSRLRSWRRAGLETPVLMLVAPGSVYEQVHGLDLEVDDWLAKPFELEELLVWLRVCDRDSQARESIPTALIRD